MYYNIINKFYSTSKIQYLLYFIILISILILILSIFIVIKYIHKTKELLTNDNISSKSIININKYKLKANPKSVSFSLNDDIVYFNEKGFLHL